MPKENPTPADETTGEAPEKALTREEIERALASGAASLTSKEENVLRMHNGIGVSPDTKLTFRPEARPGEGDAEGIEVAKIRLALIEKATLDVLEGQGGSAS